MGFSKLTGPDDPDLIPYPPAIEVAASCNLFSFLPHYFFFKIFICLFLAVLGLHCCTRTLSSCNDQDYSLATVLGLIIVVSSLVVKREL